MPKCRDCGLLGLYDLHEVVHEVGDTTRKRGRIREGKSHFACTAKVVNLDGEMNQQIQETIRLHPTQNPGEKEVDMSRVKVMETERECKSFIEWRPGFSPKDHQEIKQMLELEQMRKEQREWDLRFQEAQKKRDLEFQEQVRERDRRWRQEDQEAQRKANESFQLRMKTLETRRQILITIFGSILTVLGTMFLVWLGFKVR